ncbi:hypothetical protein BAC1_01592 [uncultured bacterium]|nr:hypothetical protein BAC1_01592 [uncultured bacterium]
MDIITNPLPAEAVGSLNRLEGVGRKIDDRLAAYEAELSMLNKDVAEQFLTEKVASQKKVEASDRLAAELEQLMEELAGADDSLSRMVAEFEDPRTEDEKRVEFGRDAVERQFKYIVGKLAKSSDGKYIDALSTDDASFLGNYFLHQEISALRSSFCQAETRDMLLSLDGGIVSEKDPRTGAVTANKLNPEAYRLHLYKQALERNDRDAIEVFEAPELEGLLFSGDNKTWAKFLALKGQALASRKDPAKEAQKSHAQALRTQAAKARLERGKKIASLIDGGVFNPDDAHLQKLSRLFGKHEIGGFNFNASFNPFLRARRAKFGKGAK